MANELTCNPLVIDTAAATTVVSGYLQIQAIRLVDTGNDIADSDSVVVTNAAGKVIWRHHVTTPGMIANVQTVFPKPINVKGLIVSTLTHGTLYVYFDGPQPKV